MVPEKNVASINAQGLIPKSRLYVHLSSVGRWHGKPFAFQVTAEDMRKDGYKFYQSVNGVWLTKIVPVEYLKANQ